MNLVPESVSSHPYYPQLLKIIRIIQFLSSVISLGLFSAYIARLTVKIAQSQGAVEGIVAAALAYTLIATLLVYLVNPGFWVTKGILAGLDVVFIIGFIAVSVLTSPGGRARAGSCRGGGSGGQSSSSSSSNNNDKRSDNGNSSSGGGKDCNLVQGTFALAIIST